MTEKVAKSGSGSFWTPEHRSVWLRPTSALALLHLVCVGINIDAEAATFVVDSTVDAGDATPGNGVCATSGAVCTLRAAVEEANAFAGADTINVPANTYNLTLGDLVVTDQLTVTGAGEATTIVDGQALDRVFDIAAGITASLSNLTVRNGNIVGFGGGIRNAGDLTLTNVTVRNNIASSSGGAIRSQGATTSLTLTNVTFSNNTAGNRGGGIYLQNTGATLVMTGGSISDNTATTQGGGIYNDDASATLNNVTVSGNNGDDGAGIFSIGAGNTLTVTDSTFSSNTSTDSGGAINVDEGTANINSSTFDANTASSEGGAIHITDTTTSLVNITVSGNTTLGNGGGASVSAGTVSFTNVTITNNSAASGGGLFVDLLAVAQLLNTIVANSTSGGDCSGTITDLGNNLDTDGTCPVGFLTAAPLLGPLANNGGPTFTHELLTGSPAIDAGTNTGCPATDQRGFTRPVGASCDIGAYEAGASAAVLTLIKRAFETDGTPIPTTSTIPGFLEFKYLLYINNKGVATSDVSVRDVLDAAFQYQAGTIQVDNSVVECALTICTAAEELTIFTAVNGATFLSDAVDGDVGSYTGASTSVDAGNENVANLQLDIYANAVCEILFSAKMTLAEALL